MTDCSPVTLSLSCSFSAPWCPQVFSNISRHNLEGVFLALISLHPPSHQASAFTLPRPWLHRPTRNEMLWAKLTRPCL